MLLFRTHFPQSTQSYRELARSTIDWPPCRPLAPLGVRARPLPRAPAPEMLKAGWDLPGPALGPSLTFPCPGLSYGPNILPSDCHSYHARNDISLPLADAPSLLHVPLRPICWKPQQWTAWRCWRPLLETSPTRKKCQCGPPGHLSTKFYERSSDYLGCGSTFPSGRKV